MKSLSSRRRIHQCQHLTRVRIHGDRAALDDRLERLVDGLQAAVYGQRDIAALPAVWRPEPAFQRPSEVTMEILPVLSLQFFSYRVSIPLLPMTLSDKYPRPDVSPNPQPSHSGHIPPDGPPPLPSG